MDPVAKKQRRRSVRNICRRSFVPPSVEYGSAWIGENQDTNISNLVKSMEELQCDDKLEDSHCNVVNTSTLRKVNSQYLNDEACDGFPFVPPINVERPVQSISCTEDEPVLIPEQDLLHSRNVLPVQLDSHLCEIRSSISTACIGESEIIGGKTNDVDISNSMACSSSIQQGNGAENQSEAQILHYFVDDNDNTGNKNISYHSCADVTVAESINIDNHFVDENRKTRNKDRSYHGCDDVHVVEGNDNINICHEISDKDKSKNHQNSNTSYKSPNNSMSPEFADFDSCHTNSAASTLSYDDLNLAVTSFINVSTGSVFNMSFSPMGARPDTPNSPSSFRSTKTNQQTSQDTSPPVQLRTSISEIVSSLEMDDPVISSDPDTSHMFYNNGMTLLSNETTAFSPQSNDPSLSNAVDEEVDKTYIIESGPTICDEVGETEPRIEHGFETSPRCGGYSNPTPSIEDNNSHVELEQVMLFDFDYKMPKRSKRRSSRIFSPHKPSYMSHSTTSVDQVAVDVGLDNGSNERTMEHCGLMNGPPTKGNDFDCLTSVTAAIEGETEINCPNVTVAETDNDCANMLTDHSMVMVDTCCHDPHVLGDGQLSQSSPQSTLTDCGNVLVHQTDPKSKKQRRKSNKLARLLEESERFLPQPVIGKENELDNSDITEVQETLTNSRHSSRLSLPSSRSLRTRKSRKSWDFRKDSQSSGNGACVVKGKDSDVTVSSVILEHRDADVSECLPQLELEDLQSIYGKQSYEAQSPQPLETVKEAGNVKAAFSKRRVKRYLKFGPITQTKEKKRIEKALNVYRGRQCYFPIAELDFERKMLDVQLYLDSDL